MDLPTKTQPIWDKCIYCREPPEAGNRLGHEHIIPLAFGGKWQLLQASCRACETITSGVEKKVADHIVTPIREHLGLKGRQQSRPRNLMPVNRVIDAIQTQVKVPPSEHPGVMYMAAFAPPGVYTGAALSEDIAGRIVVRMLAENFSERAAKIEGQINLVMRFPFDSKLFARMLAKIAHSYAMAKLGPHGFRPFLSVRPETS